MTQLHRNNRFIATHSMLVFISTPRLPDAATGSHGTSLLNSGSTRALEPRRMTVQDDECSQDHIPRPHNFLLGPFPSHALDA